MPCCLITGATGFIGGKAVKDMQRDGWIVHSLVRDPARAPISSSVLCYNGTSASLREALEVSKPDVVIHLATCYLKDHRSDQIPELISANVVFGTQLLEAMWEVGCQCMVTTGTAWQHHQVEDDTYHPATLYAASKQAFEDFARWYVDARMMRIIALHLGDTYGPGDPRPKIFTVLAEAARTGCPVELSPGGQRLDPLYVGDAVAALEVAARRVLASSKPGYEMFRVSPDRPISLREMVECWCRANNSWPDLRWGAKPYREREVMEPWRGGRILPGWKAATALEDGLASCLFGEDSLQ